MSGAGQFQFFYRDTRHPRPSGGEAPGPHVGPCSLASHSLCHFSISPMHHAETTNAGSQTESPATRRGAGCPERTAWRGTPSRQGSGLGPPPSASAGTSCCSTGPRLGGAMSCAGELAAAAGQGQALICRNGSHSNHVSSLLKPCGGFRRGKRGWWTDLRTTTLLYRPSPGACLVSPENFFRTGRFVSTRRLPSRSTS